MPEIAEKLRLDKYLWAIRIFKTRTQAASAIEDGKVKWNGAAVKPSRLVAVGDRYNIKTPFRRWTIEVTALLHNRAGYEEAVKHYIDITSEEDKQLNQHTGTSFYTGKRQSKTGHPTKKAKTRPGRLFRRRGTGLIYRNKVARNCFYPVMACICALVNTLVGSDIYILLGSVILVNIFFKCNTPHFKMATKPVII